MEFVVIGVCGVGGCEGQETDGPTHLSALLILLVGHLSILLAPSLMDYMVHGGPSSTNESDRTLDALRQEVEGKYLTEIMDIEISVY